jgi:hypothetical protein
LCRRTLGKITRDRKAVANIDHVRAGEACIAKRPKLGRLVGISKGIAPLAGLIDGLLGIILFISGG